MSGPQMNTQVGRVAPAGQGAGGVGAQFIDTSSADMRHYAAKIDEAKTPPHLRHESRPYNPQAAVANAAPTAPAVRKTVIQEGAAPPAAPTEVAAAVVANPNLDVMQVVKGLATGIGDPQLLALLDQYHEEQSVLGAGG